jgi:undecaprenyl-diphosphatase
MEVGKMDTETISIHISKTKTISILVTSLIVLAVSLILWQNQDLDNQIVISHNFIFENDLYHNTFKIISRYGMGFIAVLYGILALLTFRFKQLEALRPLFLFILLSFAFGSISGDILKQLINRARPIVELAGQIASTAPSGSPAFPSGHATKSMTLALPFVLVAASKNFTTRLVKILSLTSAVLVCYSRIALQRHFLSDVLAGFGIALLFVVIAIWIVNHFYKRRKVGQALLATLSKRLGFVFFGLAVILCLI